MSVGSGAPSCHRMRAAVTFGCSRKPGAQQNAVEVSSRVLNLYPFGIRHLRHFLRLDLQHHHTLVQDLLCFRLFSMARGTASGLPVKNTATAAGTMPGARSAKWTSGRRLLRRRRSGTGRLERMRSCC
jgi:hypothetical protein